MTPAIIRHHTTAMGHISSTPQLGNNGKHRKTTTSKETISIPYLLLTHTYGTS